MRVVEVREVQDLLDKRSNSTIINVLPSSLYEEGHIPDTINIPLENSDFVQQAKKLAFDLNAPIVVYCSGPQCNASVEAAKLLEKEGFSNVIHFKGGMEEWQNANKTIAIGK